MYIYAAVMFVTGLLFLDFGIAICKGHSDNKGGAANERCGKAVPA